MLVNWKALFSMGFAFWGVLCCTDLLGESTWKRCSYSIQDMVNDHYKEITKIQARASEAESRQKMSLPILLWNICAFLCSLVFCSVIRSMSWVVWKLFKIYNVLRNRKALTTKIVSKIQEPDIATPAETGSDSSRNNCKLIFRNQQFATENLKLQEHLQLSQELDDLKKEKNELAQQLVIAQKENLTARQQIEEYKLETFMMKEKLARTANTLKENIKYKDFASANQELITKKAHSLEMHLKEVSRDRDVLRTKLCTLEQNCSNLEDKLKHYEKQDSETNNEPEKDLSDTVANNELPRPSDTPDVDISKFQKTIMELQRSIGTHEGRPTGFEANSKISMDLEDSSVDTSNNNDSSETQQSGVKKSHFRALKQNILQYDAYKTTRTKFNLSDLKEKLYASMDTTGSSSDENNSPHRIISSTAEFQNFLKTLTLNSKSSYNFSAGGLF